MKSKRKIKLEVIVGRKKIFNANGKCDTLYFDGNTKIYWEKQNPRRETFGINLEGSTKTLDESYNLIFLATNSSAKVKKYSNNYQIKTTIGRIQNDSK